MLFRSIGKKQIALFVVNDGVRACDNRCPHEGYPLSEGSVDEDCRLTCNWHNWKFDLTTGENVFGGDALAVYATRIERGMVLVDVEEPPAEVRVERGFARLGEAADDDDYARLARELARLAALGVPLEDTVAWSIARSSEQLEYGMTHAYAAAADWLALLDESRDETERLVCALEPVAHVARDTLRRPCFPYSRERTQFDADGLCAAIEAENEALALAMLAPDTALDDLERALSRAALAHYADFGHSLIYVQKAFALCRRLGPAVREPVLSSLVRSLVYAQREDLIPEFRGYGSALARFGSGAELPSVVALEAHGVPGALEATVRGSGLEPERLFSALLEALAEALLHFDIGWMARSDRPYSDNVDWLDVTHGITFAHAVWTQCRRHPELWPAGLLQMACFVGRNARYLDRDEDVSAFSAEPDAYLATARGIVLDHGEPEPIVSAHLLKTFSAVRALRAAGHEPPALIPGLRRFFETPLPRRHVRRSARQALAFVAKEG